MAVAIIRTDTWIRHLVFGGAPRQTPYGAVDGVFYGLLSGDGDASGGNFTMNGRLSEKKKRDFVYIVGGTHTRNNAVLTSGDVFEQINTGPLIENDAVATAVTNPTFEYGGVVFTPGGNAVAMTPVSDLSKIAGMPIFGDPQIPGVFLLYAAGWQDNENGATYVSSIWGWLIRYNSFFRGVSPSLS